jgi:hypothetical protein
MAASNAHLGGFDPLLRFVAELVHRHAREGGSNNLLKIPQGEFCDRFAVAAQPGLERFDLGKMRFCLDHCRHAVERVHHERVYGMLDPQGAVLIECGDAFLGWHELGTRAVGGHLHKVHDCLLGGAVVP